MSSVSRRPGAVRRRSLPLTFILALLFPGAGHAYCGSRKAARWAFACAVAPTLAALSLDRFAAGEPKMQVILLLMAVATLALLCAALHALRLARRINLTGGLYQRSHDEAWLYVIAACPLWLLIGLSV